MKILITGGAGFIGSNLTKYLNVHQPDAHIRVIDDLSTGRIENLEGARVDFYRETILDHHALLEIVSGVDTVVHLAALGSVPRSIANPRATHDANVTGTLNVLEAARSCGVEQVIVAGSSSVYGANEKLPKSEYDWTRPMSPYGVSKLATESYAIAYGFAFGMKTLAFRFFNVFGPGQPADHAYAAVIPRFIDAALDGRALEIFGDGQQSRDFTFVSTVCETIHEAIRAQVTSADPVNLAFGTNTSLLELVSQLESVLGTTLERTYSSPRAGDVRASQSDGVRMGELFPNVRPFNLTHGLTDTVQWFQSRK
ncbi:NAD-dependent epimerase/dehydratase family protein [Paramicrobacterium agarici]|uniref:NAD-dependent epimerase/dehydratase family protein n=1 Tax=Paramicrobacterium agarici TaxID=630514 RepID=UPI00114DAF30|nr:NAD-dependent epimerase/dehydratase family protein [Microbacterium agarici]TQO23690.1 UDP-glucose 4-epimerase [Microbacterium agarici]